ncbi:MAG: hypothetical protein HQ568_08140, partial [Calditrichaeota bacterium]|nr:hypothetical protein [Calditrichota bacterium]
MKSLLICLTAIIFISGCGGWGDYQFKSDRFKFDVAFPEKWEVWDRSDDRRDYLVASLPDGPREARIILTAESLAPDVSSNEIYPSFMNGGGDASIYEDFEVASKGTMKCKNSEGRYIKVTYLTENERIKGIRSIFLGFKFK